MHVRPTAAPRCTASCRCTSLAVGDYRGCITIGGTTALFDAAHNAIAPVRRTASDLADHDFDVNAIVFVITDGADNASHASAADVKRAVDGVITSESLESLRTVLVAVAGGVQLQRLPAQLRAARASTRRSRSAGAERATLAKLASFVSRSISAQSQALGSGGERAESFVLRRSPWSPMPISWWVTPTPCARTTRSRDSSAPSRPSRCWPIGCSSSPATDMGARLLALAAAQLLTEGTLAPGLALERAVTMASGLGLAGQCLDATLLTAELAATGTQVTVAGDGVVAARRSDGRIERWCFSFRDNAPAYLSYLTDPPRLQGYLEHHGHRRCDHRIDGQQERGEEASLRCQSYVARLWLPASRYRLVALLSDGVSSFGTSTRDTNHVNVDQVVGELMGFKGLEGRFVLRRLRRMLRNAAARGWRHDDDIAVAAVGYAA